MSSLRLVGLIIGVAGLIATFLFFRGPKWSRINFVFFSVFNLSLIAVTVNPNVVNFLRDLLSLQAYQYGRILALLIISNILLVFFSVYSVSKVEGFRLQFDKLVRKLGSGYLETAADDIKAIMVLIPAFNEAENLQYWLPRMPQTIGGMEVGVLVVDDGSDDGTKEVVQKFGHLVVSNMINRGGGAALRLGYDILANSSTRICITMDADGQHQPEQIEHLVRPIIDDKYDVVIGSRVLGSREKDNPVRAAGVHIFGAVVSSLLGKRITDPSSGFRAFEMNKIKNIALREDQYHTSELIIEAVKKGLRVTEVPVTILKRKYGKSKKGKNLRYGFHFAKTIIKAWWR
ncbi:Glycosyl transferase, family 2 [Olavius algarvensis Delta 1 endosymbiont]|nr:Glycosyl transferase, family 2 [Olavius algarvensis Delta 1 endosymbiont]